MNDLIGQNRALQERLNMFAGLDEELKKPVTMKHEKTGAIKTVQRIHVAKETVGGWVEVEVPTCIYKKSPVGNSGEFVVIDEIIDGRDSQKYYAAGWFDCPKKAADSELDKPKPKKAAKKSTKKSENIDNSDTEENPEK